ncbi:MAG: IS3 family transposase [Rhodobacteraceae bacterium]|nr:IS3 family transposase [Paracoccaceae bacterium]
MTAKHAFISAHLCQFAVRLMCRVLKVCRSAYHAFAAGAVRRAERTDADAALLARIIKIFKLHKRRYGAPRIHAQLRREGWKVSRKKVAKLMKENDIRPPRRKKRCPVTTDSKHGLAPSPDLVNRQFDLLVPNTVWLADITYCATDEGWLYLASIKDMATREIVGWGMSCSLHATLCIDAMNMAIMRHRPAAGLILHSDRGVQYACHDYRRLIARHGFKQSMSRKGNCLDNAPMESFFSSIKIELVHNAHFATRNKARREIFEYIEVYYNRQRLHSAIGYKTPQEARLQMTAKIAA